MVISVLSALLTLIVVGFVLLVRDGIRQDRVTAIYEASQAAVTLTEQYMISGSLNQATAFVDGFGIYAPDGSDIARFGSAPQSVLLPAQRTSGSVSTPGASDARISFSPTAVTVVRTFGGFAMSVESRGEPPGPAAASGAYSPASAPERQAGAGRRIVYIEYNIAGIRSHGATRLGVLSGFAGMFAILSVALVLTLSRLQQVARSAQERDRMAQIGEAARTLAHEIRNPLSALKMQHAIMKRVAPGSMQTSLGIMEEEVERIVRITDRVRDFLRNPVGHPEAVRIDAFLSHICDRTEVPIRIAPPAVDRAGRDASVFIDPEHLNTVIMNLVRNAWESMSDSGAASTADTGDRAVELAVSAIGSRITLSVLDRGVGIPSGAVDHLFDPFFTTKTTGSGVGLAVSRRFVVAAGGSLTLVRRTGGGTVATVTLPVARNVGAVE